MKKLICFGIILLLLPLALAVEKPGTFDIHSRGSLFGRGEIDNVVITVPYTYDFNDTGTYSQVCNTMWQIKNSYCSGNIRVYEQCVRQTATIGLWLPRSEKCAPGFECKEGECKYTGVVPVVNTSTPVCGNSICESGESISCPGDCTPVITPPNKWNIEPWILGLIIVVIAYLLFFRKKGRGRR